MKENFTITDKETGKVYWISRAHAVACIIMASHNDKHYFLFERRGPGCPDNIGKLCCVCGYVNWGETRKEAVIREAYEETGIKLDPKWVIEDGIVDDPSKDARENIVTRYTTIVNYEDMANATNDSLSRGGEDAEVSEFVILTYDEIKETDSNEFAFGHKEMIIEIIEGTEETEN